MWQAYNISVVSLRLLADDLPCYDLGWDQSSSQAMNMRVETVNGTLRQGAQSLPGLTHAGNLQGTVEAWTAKRDTEDNHVTRAQPR